jgi:solute carrier family 25 protein 39/40
VQFKDAFLKISRNEGIYSLWSGLGPTLVLSIPTTILYFVSYEQLRLKMKEVYNKKLQPGQEKLQPHWIPLIAGASARVFAVTVVSPLELIRTKMQSRKISYSGKRMKCCKSPRNITFPSPQKLLSL